MIINGCCGLGQMASLAVADQSFKLGERCCLTQAQNGLSQKTK
jgi:hypothetical protein